jgi:hypothetical protein
MKTFKIKTLVKILESIFHEAKSPEKLETHKIFFDLERGDIFYCTENGPIGNVIILIDFNKSPWFYSFLSLVESIEVGNSARILATEIYDDLIKKCNEDNDIVASVTGDFPLKRGNETIKEDTNLINIRVSPFDNRVFSYSSDKYRELAMRETLIDGDLYLDLINLRLCPIEDEVIGCTKFDANLRYVFRQITKK